MNQLKHVKNFSKHEMRLIAKMRGINVKKSTSKIELFRILTKDKITYKESLFKSIIVDSRNKLSKHADKLIEKGLYYAEKNERINRITSKKHQRKMN